MNSSAEKKLSGDELADQGNCFLGQKSQKGPHAERTSFLKHQDARQGSQVHPGQTKEAKKMKSRTPETDLVDRLRLKTTLKVLRSNLTADEKLSAIKRSHDALHRVSVDAESEDDLEELFQIDLNLRTNDTEQCKLNRCRNEGCEPRADDNTNPLHPSAFLHNEFNAFQLNDSQHEGRNLNLTTKSYRTVEHSETVTHSAKLLLHNREEQEDVRLKASMQSDWMFEKSSQERLASARHSFRSQSLGMRSVTQIIDDETNGVAHENVLSTSKKDLAFACERMSRKSPVHVQQWIESIDACPQQQNDEETSDNTSYLSDSCVSTDNRILFTDEQNNIQDLHYEAQNLPDAFNVTEDCIEKGNRPQHPTLAQLKEKQDSFQSDVSNFSSSSLSSIDTLLEARKGDPEKILLNLGFGGNCDVNSPFSRIPERFLQPSQVKGNNFNKFIHQEAIETLEFGSRFNVKVPSWLENSSYSCSLDETSSRSSNDLPVSTAAMLINDVSCSEMNDITPLHFSEDTFHDESDVSHRTCIVTIKVEDVG